jgi:hypothetical protein
VDIGEIITQTISRISDQTSLLALTLRSRRRAPAITGGALRSSQTRFVRWPRRPTRLALAPIAGRFAKPSRASLCGHIGGWPLNESLLLDITSVMVTWPIIDGVKSRSEAALNPVRGSIGSKMSMTPLKKA